MGPKMQEIHLPKGQGEKGAIQPPIKPHCKHEVQNEVKVVPKNCRYKKSLKKVLLAINFNFVHYKLIPTLRKFYSPYFRKVVFCGAEENAKYGHIIKMNTNGGYQGYHCLAKAIEIYHGDGSDFDGYFYSNDDVILNFWNLNGDTNKIWLGDRTKWLESQRISEPVRKDWIFWVGNKERCELILNKLGNDSTADSYVKNYHRNTLRNFYNKTISKDQLSVQSTKQEQRVCLKSWSDAFYIPARHAESYLRLANMFEAEKMFLEIASPMILHLLDDSTQMLNMEGIYHVMRQFGFYGTYSFNSTFSHPFKLSDGTNWNFFKNVIEPYSHRITSEC